MGNVEKTYDTRQYQFTLRMDTGKKVSITAFGMDRTTGAVSRLSIRSLPKEGGTHPDLVEETKSDSNLVKIIHNSKIRHEAYHILLDTHPEFYLS